MVALLALGCTSNSPGAAGGAAAPELTWTEAAPCPLARFEANGAVIDGELWVMGGFISTDLVVTRSVHIYDPDADTWREGPELPGAETHFGVVTLGGDILVAGGFSGNFSGPRLPTSDAVWRLDTATEQWSPGPSLPTAGAAFAWALLGTELHLAGGLGPDGDTDAAAHHVWDTAGAEVWTSAAPLPTLRNHGGGAASAGLFYAIAGRLSWDEVAGDVLEVDAFDPMGGTWSERAPIPGPRSEIGASTSTLSDGRILVVGGSLPGKMPSDDVLIYDPSLNQWAALPALPQKRKGAVAVQVGRRLVVTTGSPTSTDPSATTFVGCCL